MKIHLTIEIIRANGSKESSQISLEKPEIFIGRDAAADIRLESRFAALKHARIYFENQEFFIEDLGSLAGTLVNQAPVRRHRIASGDLILLGDVKFQIGKIENETLEVLRIQDEGEQLDLGSRIGKDAHSLDLGRWMKFVSIFSIVSVFVVSFLFLFFPWVTDSKSSWNPGSLAIGHRPLETKCSSCHEGSGSADVPDQKCLNCHEMSDHANLLKADKGPACVSCHTEHRGDFGLLVHDSRECSQCHASSANLSTSLDGKKAQVELVDSYERHPDFKRSKESDDTPLKFNHAIHLKGPLLTRTDSKTLACADCHRTSADRETMEPVRFEEDCHSCHSLEFEAGKEVPHGKNQEVLPFLLANLKSLEKSRRAEEILFTRTACALCHEVKKKAGSDLEGHYEVLPPKIPTTWLNTSVPIHASHKTFACTHCHQARESSETSHILIPKIQDCQSCHSSKEEFGKIATDCSFCHSYHKSLELPVEKRNRASENY